MINYEPQSPGLTEMTKTFITVWTRCMPVVQPLQTTLWICSLRTNGEENSMNQITRPVEWSRFESSANQRHKPNFQLCWEIIQSKLSANATQSRSFWKNSIFEFLELLIFRSSFYVCASTAFRFEMLSLILSKKKKRNEPKRECLR